MIKKFIDPMCMQCKEAIYNPLCPKCIAREIEVWLKDKPESVKLHVLEEVSTILNASMEMHELSVVEFQRCLKCHKKTVSLCPYCFAEAIYKKMKNEKVSREILMEFVQLFNFNFGDTYLYREAEKLGLI
jgi:hypothetical protein